MASARVRRHPARATPERPSRRAKAAVSYAEQDSDAPIALSEFEDEEAEQSEAQLESEGEYAAPATRRKRSSPRPVRQQPSKRRRAAAKRQIRDVSDSEINTSDTRGASGTSDTSDSNTEDEILREPMARPRKRSRKPATRRANGRAPRTPPKVVKKKPAANIDIHSDGKIPAWSTLPYHVLLNIFSFVAAPLLDERTFQATPNFKSVLNASKVCRAWSEPALTVLWQDPVLVPMERAHLFSDALKLDPEKTSYNYRHKVQHISLEVLQSATYTLSHAGVLDVADLIYHCPRLSTLEICHQKDLAPYRDLDESIKWSYPPELFGALAQNISNQPTLLKSWRWSSRLVTKAPINGGYDFTLLNTVHLTPSFQNLRKLAFVNYQTPDLPRRIPPGFVYPETEKNLADAIALLPNLKHLVLEACGIVNGTLLPLLPTTLQHLEITACGELLGDDFAAFLLTHGSQLKSLVLDHNQALSLSWLTILKDACPKLEFLSCNLAYYNLHGTYKDNEPTFKELLGVDEIPTWPSTLRALSLTQLRKWEAKAAENLFSSLLDSAAELPDLRVLIVKAILDSISWRDRGGFRDRWLKAFDKVFKRKSAPPAPYLSSIGAHRFWKSKMVRIAKEREEPIPISSDVEVAAPKTVERRNGKRPSIETPEEEDSDDIPLIRLPRRSRVAKPAPRFEVPPTPSQESIKYQPRRDKEVEWLRQNELVAGVGAGDGNGQQNGQDSDDEPIAKRRTRRSVKTNTNSTPQPKLTVLVDGRYVITPGGTRYGGSGSSDHDASDGSLARDQHVQGMCDIVELRIDNLRPTENQFTEADFLDSEPEEDGEWDGEGGDENGWVW